MDKFKFFYWGPCLTVNSVPEELMKTVDVLYENTCVSKQTFHHKLPLNFQSEYNLLENDQQELFKVLNFYFLEYLDFYNKEFNNTGKLAENPEVVSCWVNNQQQHEFRPPHTHDQDLSFVLYVDIPEKLHMEHMSNPKEHRGGVVFSYGYDMLSGSSKFEPNTSFHFFPKRGDLYIFPNYLVHYSMPFFTPCVRKSISGNIVVK